MKKKAFAQVNIPVDDLERLRQVAELERRSMGGQVSYWIEQYFNQQQREAG